MTEQGWVKLYRSMLEKPIWLESTPEQKTILITLLLMANHQEKEWEWRGEKYTAKPGQFITSLEAIRKISGKGISFQNVRTALKRFEKYEFLTSQSTNKNRLITLLNWELYQSKQENQQTDQQATNKQLTTNKNVKNERSKKDKSDKSDSLPYLEVISYLNSKAGKNFRNVESNKKLIRARFKEGYSLEDFKKVIDVKCNEWLNNDDMKKYLQPSTLFGPKFDNYLNELPKQPSKAKEDPAKRII